MPNRLLRSFRALVLVCGCCAAQSGVSPHFEVASVKRELEARGFESFSGGPGSTNPERVTIERTPMQELIVMAYGVESYQISGPTWIATERYTVTAKLAKGTNDEQFRQMMANLLAERFGLVLHRVAKEFPGYEITLDTGRTGGLTPSPEKPDAQSIFRKEAVANGLVHYTFTQTSMESLANRLSIMIPRRGPWRTAVRPPVNDRTGLSGKFDFQLDIAEPTSFSREEPSDVEDNSSSIADALRNQLGLKLNRAKIGLEELVIDHLDRVPVQN
jgi:uncharacterized protein (TIGR03435 family)